MRSDSEVLAQIASDVAEIKAAVFGKGQAQEPFRAGLPPERLRKVWAEWEEKDSGLVDFRGNEYRGTMGDGTRDQRWRPMAELGGFADRNLWAFRPHGATWTHVERLAQEREAQERLLGTCTTCLSRSCLCGAAQPKVAPTSENLTDLRKLVGGVCKPLRDVVALKANQERLLIPAGAPFLVKRALPARDDVIVQCCGIEGWLPAMQEVEVISEPPRLNYRYSDVVLRADVVVSIRPKSEAFTIATIRLKPLVAFKPERLTVSLTQSARWQNPTKVSRAEFLDLGHLTIMRIRAGDKDVITEPVSAQSQSLGGGFAWPAVRADSEIEITLAISKSVLDRALPPFGLTKGDLLWVAVRVSLILTGSKLR